MTTIGRAAPVVAPTTAAASKKPTLDMKSGKTGLDPLLGRYAQVQGTKDGKPVTYMATVPAPSEFYRMDKPKPGFTGVWDFVSPQELKDLRAVTEKATGQISDAADSFKIALAETMDKKKPKSAGWAPK